MKNKTTKSKISDQSKEFSVDILIFLIVLFCLITIYFVIPPFYAGLGTLIIGFITVLSSVIRIKKRDKDHWLELKNELSLYLNFSWAICAGIAAMIVGVYYILTSNPFSEILYCSENEIQVYREPTVFLMFVSVIAIMTGIHALYKKHAPMISVGTFLNRLTKDIERNCNTGSTLLIAYPALNFGQHREFEKYGENEPDNTPFKNYKKAISDFVNEKETKVNIYTYPTCLYKPFWEQYTNVSLLDEDENSRKKIENKFGSIEVFIEKSIDICTNGSLTLWNKFEIMSKGGQMDPSCILNKAEIPPNRFPQHIVIINEITYLISSYGIPYYEENENNQDNLESGEYNGTFKNGDPKRATLLIYRYEDENFAKLVRYHLERQVKEILDIKENHEEE